MNSLSHREKNTLITGTVLAAVFLFFQFVFLPLLDKKKDLERILLVEKQSFAQIKTLEKQYRTTTQNLDMQRKILETRATDFTLFSFLDFQAEKSGVKSHIDYMRPLSVDLEDGPYAIAKIKLKLKAIYLNNLTEFIRRVETSENGIHTVSLSLSPAGRNKNLLDAAMEFQTLITKESN
jgi:hypothetical protein